MTPAVQKLRFELVMLRDFFFPTSTKADAVEYWSPSRESVHLGPGRLLSHRSKTHQEGQGHLGGNETGTGRDWGLKLGWDTGKSAVVRQPFGDQNGKK
jgi:hypothetical protein